MKKASFDKAIKNLNLDDQVFSVGKVLSIGDGIAQVTGLANVKSEELVSFPNGSMGLVFDLKPDATGVIILGDYLDIKEGDQVQTTGRVLSIPVSNELLGRVVDPLMQPLDGLDPIDAEKHTRLEKIAPGVISRKSVDTPLQTGIKAIDAIIPIGRGQRELIIGDRGTGKTAIAIDTIINQKAKGVQCIYVSIGQKGAKLARIVDRLKAVGAMEYTTVVAANASHPASLQYLAPYAGCSVGEYYMSQGKDALVVYDDLSKHAWAYRQISLLLRRPSGREAYPGDIFYLHSRLLERACRLDKKHGGGSLTALPIIETLDNDVSAYIPTNVISITDGQIYLESDLFYAGIRPAVNTGLSVSRVGGAAQIKAMKKVAGQLRLDLAQYRELAAFTQFTTDLDPATKKKIDRGSRISELLKQPQYQPLDVSYQVAILWVATNGYLDDIPVAKISEFEAEFYEYLDEVGTRLTQEIEKTGKLTESAEQDLKQVTTTFKEEFVQKHQLELEKQELDKEE